MLIEKTKVNLLTFAKRFQKAKTLTAICYTPSFSINIKRTRSTAQENEFSINNFSSK